jgi:hypothetical protein
MTILGEFFRRIVGIVYFSSNKREVRIAHISFWGNRHDFIIDAKDIRYKNNSSTIGSNVTKEIGSVNLQNYQ